jgi:hypothetical protein
MVGVWFWVRVDGSTVTQNMSKTGLIWIVYLGTRSPLITLPPTGNHLQTSRATERHDYISDHLELCYSNLH